MRVLHLIDPGSPGGGASTLHLLEEVTSRLRSAQHDVLILGHRAHRELAERCGVRTIGELSSPTFFPKSGRRALRTLLQVRAAAGIRYDLIHTWTARATLLASVTAPETKRLATLFVGPVSNFETRLLTAALERHPAPILNPVPAVQHEYHSLGLPRRHLSILPPGVNPEAVEFASRETVRQRWEIEDDEFAIGLLSEPLTWADARQAAETLTRLAHTGRRVRLIMHHRAARRGEGDRWLRQLGQSHLAVIDDELAEPWRAVNGLDAAITIGDEADEMDLAESGSPFAVLTGGGRRIRPLPSVLPLLWAMAAGVPIVAPKSTSIAAIAREGEQGLFVPPGDINAVCDRLSRLYDDETLCHRIGAAARERAQRDFHISAFCVRLKEAYELHLADRPVRVLAEDDDPIIEQITHVPSKYALR
ncbi:MAG: glycosyltransferase [Phycisphaerales bacterium]|nr:MAG: glycosyltransferase [Phycisphaerales bacterium]